MQYVPKSQTHMINTLHNFKLSANFNIFMQYVHKCKNICTQISHAKLLAWQYICRHELHINIKNNFKCNQITHAKPLAWHYIHRCHLHINIKNKFKCTQSTDMENNFICSTDVYNHLDYVPFIHTMDGFITVLYTLS